MPVGDEVAALLRRGDVHGAATLVLRTEGPAVLRYLRAVLREEGEEADAFSLFGEWVWRSLPSYRGEGTLRAWCLGIAAHAARKVRSDAWRRRRRRLGTTEASRLAESVRASWSARDRAEQQLDDLRRDLDPDDRELLALRLDQRLAWEEVARVLAQGGEEVTPGALRKRYERLRERVAHMARKRGMLD